MGIFSSSNNTSIDQTLKNSNELLEAYIYEELSHLTDEKKQEFLNSDEAKAMEEAGIIGKRTLVRLSKQDDIARRTKMASFQLAKEADDPLWNLLVKNRIKERELIAKIVQKYGNRAVRVAKMGQKDYLKNRMPASYMRGGNDR